MIEPGLIEPETRKAITCVRPHKRRIINALNAIGDLRITLVGDTITDEYEFVLPLGKSLKANMLTVEHRRSETYAGGVHAAANHLVSFAPVQVICEKETILRRYVDINSMQKLFEVYRPGNLCSLLNWSDLDDADVVIVLDFGHGLMTKEAVKRVSETDAFLAVNCQTNTANHGYNLITKYPRADYVSIDTPEARLAMRDRDGHIFDVVQGVAVALNCPNVIVTQGKDGCVGLSDGTDGCFVCPAITARVVDNVGAGDAFLAITAPLVKLGLPLPLVAFVGNVVGAIKVGEVGHRKPVTKQEVVDAIQLLLE